MGIARTLTAAAFVAAATIGVTAQSPERVLTPLETAVACAPPPSLDLPSDPLRIVGTQDSVSRVAYHDKDVLVIGGGINSGVQVGQRYYIRRPVISGSNRSRPAGIMTLGWLRVAAVNETNAIASTEHFCDSISQGDYLEPFAVPVIPDGADRDNPSGEPDFGSLGRVLSGVGKQSSGGSGDLMLIDRGTEQGTTAGARFAVYRDMRAHDVPLASIGEGVVLSTGKTMSLMRITRSRDAVIAGDYVVPRK